MSDNFTTCYIALGANLGDRAGTIASAIQRLRQTSGIRVTRLSSLLENPAVGGPKDSPAFLNGVVEIETTFTPRQLMDQLLQIEHELGRRRDPAERFAPRTIDLDLLLFGPRVIREDDLIVPHPRMHERRFVLQPLAEIAPDVIHPVLNRSVASLLASL